MANQTNQQGNQKGKNGFHHTPPTFTIVGSAGDPVVVGDNFEVIIEARVFRNDQSVRNEGVILKNGIHVVAKQSTDSTGTCIFKFTTPLTNHGQLLPLRLQLVNYRTESNITISLPKRSNQMDKDPDRIQLRYYTVSDSGSIFLSLILMQHKGFALEGECKINFKGIDDTFPIESNGHINVMFENALCPGEDEILTAWVSGIISECVLHVYRPRVKLTPVEIFVLFIKRVSFIVLTFSTLLSMFFGSASLLMIFRKSFKERLESSDGSSDILWVGVFILCFFPPFLLLCNIVWFWFRLKMSRAFEVLKKNTVYHRSSVAKDSYWEKIAETLQQFLATDPKVNIKNQASENSSSAKNRPITNLKVILLSILSDIGFDWVGKILRRGI